MGKNLLNLIIQSNERDIDVLIANRIKTLQQNCTNQFFSYNYDKSKTNSFGSFIVPQNLIQISDYPSWYISFDDQKNIYFQLAKNLKNNSTKNIADFDLICDCVRDTVYSMVGQTNRAENFDRCSKFTFEKDNVCPISNFFGRDISECSERAIIAHNLFKFMGIESYLMEGVLNINNNQQLHNYNIVYNEEKGILFDLACTPYKKNQKGELERNPVIKFLTKKEMIMLKEQRDNIQCCLYFGDKLEPVFFEMPSGKKYKLEYGLCTTVNKQTALSK